MSKIVEIFKDICYYYHHTVVPFAVVYSLNLVLRRAASRRSVFSTLRAEHACCTILFRLTLITLQRTKVSLCDIMFASAYIRSFCAAKGTARIIFLKGDRAMVIRDGKVIFLNEDMKFVDKFGIMEATDMVLDFCSTHSFPLVYDTFQLAGILGVKHQKMFRYIKDIKNLYHECEIPKANGTVRRLNVPCLRLRNIQRRIAGTILSQLPTSNYAKAYRLGVSLKSNAQPHVGKKYILKMDITDFFGSISFDQVYSAAFNTRNFPKNIGVMLTTLCCYDGYLPQGAPTSPALSNLVLKNFDNCIGSWCEQRGISYTRYCDDMTFSSDKPLYVCFEKVSRMLQEMGFTVNAKKTKFITAKNRMSVTGLTVNEKVSVSKEYKRNLRQEIYYVLKFGLKSAILDANRTDFIDERGRALEYKYFCSLYGKICYILSIEPQNKWFGEVFKKFEKHRQEI